MSMAYWMFGMVVSAIAGVLVVVEHGSVSAGFAVFFVLAVLVDIRAMLEEKR